MFDAAINGTKVKHLRIGKRKTAVEFARLVGISTEWLRQIENGKRDPSPVVKGKIADALDVPVDLILRDESDSAAA